MLPAAQAEGKSAGSWVLGEFPRTPLLGLGASKKSSETFCSAFQGPLTELGYQYFSLQAAGSGPVSDRRINHELTLSRCRACQWEHKSPLSLSACSQLKSREEPRLGRVLLAHTR